MTKDPRLDVPIYLEDVSGYFDDFFVAVHQGDIADHGLDRILVDLHKQIGEACDTASTALKKYFERLEELKAEAEERPYHDPNDEHRLSKAQLGLTR